MARARSKSPSPMHRLVYSTEEAAPSAIQGGGKKTSGKARGKKAGRAGAFRAPADGVVRIWRQVKGRKGKGVTVVTGLELPSAELSKLAGELKKKCGSGGTAKDAVIEIQGDHRETVADVLRRRGFRVKLAGG